MIDLQVWAEQKVVNRLLEAYTYKNRPQLIVQRLDAADLNAASSRPRFIGTNWKTPPAPSGTAGKGNEAGDCLDKGWQLIITRRHKSGRVIVPCILRKTSKNTQVVDGSGTRRDLHPWEREGLLGLKRGWTSSTCMASPEPVSCSSADVKVKNLSNDTRNGLIGNAVSICVWKHVFAAGFVLNETA